MAGEVVPSGGQTAPEERLRRRRAPKLASALAGMPLRVVTVAVLRRLPEGESWWATRHAGHPRGARRMGLGVTSCWNARPGRSSDPAWKPKRAARPLVEWSLVDQTVAGVTIRSTTWAVLSNRDQPF